MVSKSEIATPDQKKVIALKPKEVILHHAKMSVKDIQWIRRQPFYVQQLAWDCLAVEQFGKQLRKLETKLSKNSFRQARIALQERGLFRFEPVTELTPSGRSRIIGWQVENLHGYYYKEYWAGGHAFIAQNLTAESQNLTAESQNLTAESQNLTAESQNLGDETAKTIAAYSVDFSQPCLNHVSTTHQLPTKVVGGVVSLPQETEAALGGQLPTSGGMPEEEVSIQSSPSLLDQPKAAGGEPRDLGQDQYSAAAPPVSANFPQPGDTVVVDWPPSAYNRRIGIAQRVYIETADTKPKTETRIADIEIEGMAYNLPFPTSQLRPYVPTAAAPVQESQGMMSDASATNPGLEKCREVVKGIIRRNFRTADLAEVERVLAQTVAPSPTVALTVEDAPDKA